MDASTFRDLDSGCWAEVDPDDCPCHGRGWMLSDFDTWHKCPIHSHGAVGCHEDDPRDFSDSHRLEMLELAYQRYEGSALRAGFEGDFRAACAALVTVPEPTPREWLDAARGIADALEYERREKAARDAGYSCALEAELDAEAAYERGCR